MKYLVTEEGEVRYVVEVMRNKNHPSLNHVHLYYSDTTHWTEKVRGQWLGSVRDGMEGPVLGMREDHSFYDMLQVMDIARTLIGSNWMIPLTMTAEGKTYSLCQEEQK